MTEATCSSHTTMTTPALHLACALSSTAWVLAFTAAPALRATAAAHRRRRMWRLLPARLPPRRQRFGLALDAGSLSCYEAGAMAFGCTAGSPRGRSPTPSGLVKY